MQGSTRERELFANCVTSTESKALRHLFFAEREVAKVPDVPKDTPTKEIKRAAVVGAGTMGGGIAMSFANAGVPVTILEMKQDALDKGLATVRRNYEASMKRGKLDAKAMERNMALLHPTLSYADIDSVDLVIEAVFEDMNVKQAVFTEPLAAACEVLDQLNVKKFREAAVLGDGKLAQLIALVLRTCIPHVVLYGKHEKKLALARRGKINTKMVRGDASDLNGIHETFPLLVEATGSPTGLTLAQQMTEPRGTLVLKSTFHGAAPVETWPIG